MKNRNDNLNYISLMRVLSMLQIVLFHSLCFYIGEWWFLCTDVVPLWRIIAFPIEQIGLTSFVFISGFLYGYMYIEKGKYRDVLPFLHKKILRLLIPYFFWGIMMIITMPKVPITWINLLTGISHLWFLLMLFELFVIIVILNRIGICESSTRSIDLIVIITSFLFEYGWNNYSSHQYALGIGSTLFYLPAFLVGYFFAKYWRDQDCSFNSLLSTFVIGIILNFFLSLNGYVEGCTLYRIPSILVAISSMMLVKKSSVSFSQSIVIDNLDKNSMGIYIFNQIAVFAILLLPELNMFLSHHEYVGVAIIFIISLVIPWGLSDLLRKIKKMSFLIG